MERPIRIEYNGAFYHVTARGNERKRIFLNKVDYYIGVSTETGDLFGGLSYSAVSKVNTIFSEKIEKEREIRRGVQKIMRDLSHVKALTPFPHISLQIYHVASYE